MPKVKKKVPAAKERKAAKVKKVTGKKAVTKRTKKKVSAIPKGYHNITPYLTVENGANAIAFYKKAFGAKSVTQMDMNGKISHAEMKIGDSMIMLGEACPEDGARVLENRSGSSVTIHLYIKDVDTVVKSAVTAGAKLIRPVENMFYGDRSAMIQDPFGHMWCVSTHIEDVSLAQVKKRAAEKYGENKK